MVRASTPLFVALVRASIVFAGCLGSSEDAADASPQIHMVPDNFLAADPGEATWLEPIEKDGDVLVYRVPVSGLMGDGPCGKRSQWVFLFLADVDAAKV